MKPSQFNKWANDGMRPVKEGERMEENVGEWD